MTVRKRHDVNWWISVNWLKRGPRKARNPYVRRPWRRPASPSRSANTAIWHFQSGKVNEILTLQDQFAILKQIGYLPESAHAA